MSELQTFLKDKKYGFVPLIDECIQDRGSSHQNIDLSTFSGKLKIRLQVLTPLHIGSGNKICNEQGQIVHLMMRRNGQLVIPGSSMKGVIRGIAEAISYSCKVILPNNTEKSLSKVLPRNNGKSCMDIENLCPTCSIFGMISNNCAYMGKVKFGEFTCGSESKTIKINLMKQELPFKDYPKEHDVFKKQPHGNERLYYCKACDTDDCYSCSKQNYFSKIEEAGKQRKMEFRGRKFYFTNKKELSKCLDEKRNIGSIYEMLDCGSELYGELIVENLKVEELKLLTYALNIENQFQLKLGYGKSMGYGCVKVILEEVEDLAGRYKNDQSILTKEMVEQYAYDYKNNGTSKIKDRIRCLEEIMEVE